MTIRRRGRPHLEVTGMIAAPQAWSPDELASLPGAVPDVSGLLPGFAGRAAPLAGLLDAAGVAAEADHVTVESEDGHYRASIPLADLRREGWIIFGLGGHELPRDRGGPLRVVIRYGRTLCWNVKAAAGLRVTIGPEPDSVPENPPH